MPELTPRLGIKKPLGTETVNRASFNENWDIIDQNAASRAEVDAKFDPASGHKHTGQDGDAPPIPLAGIDPQARTSAGGTEPNRLAVTDSNGRVGDTNKLAGCSPTTAGGTEANRVAVTNAAGRVGDSERLGGMTADDVLCQVWMGV